MKIDCKKILIIFLKLISSLSISFFVFILLTGIYTITNVPINIFLVLILLIILLLYLNWSIWTNGIFKKLIMLAVLFFIFLFLGFWFVDYMGIKSDYCIEDGDCKAGRVIYANGQKILINKENCIKNGFEWYEKNQMCKIDVNIAGFRVEKVIYD